MGKTFQSIHCCSFGKFGGNGDKIGQWIRVNGGTYSKDINDKVTHLITTKEAFKKDVEAVQKAKQLGTVKIVSYEWLEDSLLSKTRKPKKEKPYLLETILNNEMKKERKAVREQKKQLQTTKKNAAVKDPFTTKTRGTKTGSAASNYYVYIEKNTKVTYTATIFRPLLSKNSREKFEVKIHETKNMPQIYATHVKYSRVGKSSTEFLAPLGSDLNTAMTAFSEFFKEKTGKEWEERMDGISPPPKMDGEGNQLPAHEGWFYYEEQRTMLSFFLRHGMTKTSTAITAQQGHGGSSLLDEGPANSTSEKQDHSDKTLDLEHREDKLQENKENSAAGSMESAVCADGP